MDEFIRQMPKAELHLHIEGTLEAEMAFALAERNGVDLPFSSVEDLRAALDFTDLQSFLDVYYSTAVVLQTAADFHDLTVAYLEKAAADGVRRAEIFFDPQTHTAREIPFDAVVEGIHSGLEEGGRRFGVSTGLIMCFLRHLPPDEAMATLEAGLAHRDKLLGVGLDSSELGNPPDLFVEVFERARAEGLHTVAHAGEEGPPSYIWGALDLLGAERIDHGVRAEEDPELVARLARDRIPLTMCPLSNVRLRVFDRLEDHNLRRLMEAGVPVTINSDDPAFFGGYIGTNYVQTAAALGLDRHEVVAIARTSLEATFLPAGEKTALIAELDAYVEAG